MKRIVLAWLGLILAFASQHLSGVSGFFWMQGESAAPHTDYAANLTNFIASLQHHFNTPKLPFVFG